MSLGHGRFFIPERGNQMVQFMIDNSEFIQRIMDIMLNAGISSLFSFLFDKAFNRTPNIPDKGQDATDE